SIRSGVPLGTAAWAGGKRRRSASAHTIHLIDMRVSACTGRASRGGPVLPCLVAGRDWVCDVPTWWRAGRSWAPPAVLPADCQPFSSGGPPRGVPPVQEPDLGRRQLVQAAAD